MKRNRIGMMIGAGALFATPAVAGVFESAFDVLDFVATPSGSPVFTDGAGFRNNGARSGRVRVVPNLLGAGYRLEFDRTFGADVSGRPETFDFGNLELQLAGSIESTMSFTRRGLPTGNVEFSASNLQYAIRGKTGGQDVIASGTLNVSNNFEINPLGFYTVDVVATNTNSQIFFDGLAVEGSRDTDFDLGPISLRGNIYADALLYVLSSFGVDVSELTGLFPQSPIDRITQAISQRLADETTVLGETISADGFDLGSAKLDLNSRLFSPIEQGPTQTPEPASVALLALGAVAGLRRR